MLIQDKIKISAVLNIHNEEKQLEDCLKSLNFVDEIIIVLDKCTDKSKNIAQKYTKKIFEGSWHIEGDRRNLAIGHASNEWIFEIDADERVPKALAEEIIKTVHINHADWYPISVDNYIGGKLVKYGWGAYFGRSAYPGLFKKNCKVWGKQRVHPQINLSGKKGAPLKNSIIHFIDNDISGLIKKLDSYSSARAKDILENSDGGSFFKNITRIFSRFWKCFILRKGYKEGKYGFIIALFAGLYPILSYLKAFLDENKKK